MTPVAFVLAAALGAVLRYGVGALACSWKALLIVNVSGSGLLGVVLGADLSASATTVLATGLCGALTTLSSFSLELRALPTRAIAAGYAIFTVACCCGAVATGLSIGESF